MTLTKSAPTLVNGNQIPYTINYTNPGPRPVENVKLTDKLPAGTTYLAGAGVPAPTTTSGGVLTWNLPPLASGASGSVTFMVTVATNGTYANTANMRFSHVVVRAIFSNTVMTIRDAVTPTPTPTATPIVALVSIEVTPTNPAVPAGLTQAFTATGTFSDGTTQDLTAVATWSSNDPSVATISNASGSEGVATAVSPGTTEIAAQSGSVSGSTTLTVTDAVLVSIEVTPTNPTVPAGLTQAFTATGTFSDGSNRDLTDSVMWSSSDNSVATISNAAGSKGVATGISPGTTQISARSGGISGSTTLTVTPAPTPSATPHGSPHATPTPRPHATPTPHPPHATPTPRPPHATPTPPIPRPNRGV